MYGNPGNIVGWHIELCANAQNNRLGGETDYSLQLEDSDGVTSSDYYSGKVAVRTGLEVYNLFWYNEGVCMTNSQNTLVGIVSIPPSKIKQLEKLIKERCKGEFKETDPMLTERTRNSSYAIARYIIYFSKFSL